MFCGARIADVQLLTRDGDSPISAVVLPSAGVTHTPGDGVTVVEGTAAEGLGNVAPVV